MEGSLFHYTDINAVRGMLEHKKLWLTGHEFMNDEHEFIDGFHMLQQHVEEHLNRINADLAQRAVVEKIIEYLNETLAFSCSFSKSSDMLSQWRSYCPEEGGFCVEFDANILHQSVINPSRKPIRKFEECIYTNEEKTRQSLLHAEHCINGLMKSHSPQGERMYQTYLNFLLFCLRCKNEYFAEEQEIRLCTYSSANRLNNTIVDLTTRTRTDTPIFVNEKLSFRTNKNLFIPYIEQPFNLSAIKSITVGPNKNMDTTVQGLGLFLREFNLIGQIDINVSQIPYRKW